MNILVTGGAGFIGSNFIRKSLGEGNSIINVDKLTYSGNLNNLKDISGSNYEFIKSDVCDEGIISKIVKKADAIVHFAAESHVTRSETNPDLFYRTNLEGTRNLLECAVRSGNIKRFIHISTDEVYGSAVSAFKEEDKIKGDSQASSPYSKSKSLADDLALSYADKLSITVVRPTNNFGPYQYPEKALPRWVIRLIQGKKIPVWGRGENVRDWLFVGDTIKAISLLLEKGKSGEAYNIAANNRPEIRNIDLAELLVGYFSLGKSEIEFVPDPRPNHDFKYSVNTEKIEHLGFRTSQDTRTQIIATTEWYVINKEWWQPLVEEAEHIYSDMSDKK
jgi:dTDP-glucose 4,6-dehydratase